MSRPLKVVQAPEPAIDDVLLTLDELDTANIAPIRHLVGPIIAPSVTLLHAPPGVGKSMFAHELALAVATGESAFAQGSPQWRIEETGPVLLVDGELPLDELRRRLAGLRAGRKGDAIHLLSNFALEAQGQRPIDLSREESRLRLEAVIDRLKPKLLVLDNLATLTSEHYAEDDARAQRPLNKWQAGLRERGVSVILIHHDNKGGKQRGSSDRETVCDQTIHLTRMPSSAINQAAFVVSFGKVRYVQSQATEFAAMLDSGQWRFDTAETGTMAKFLAHMEEVEEFNYRDVMLDLSISKPHAYRLVRQARDAGLWKPGWKGPRRRRTPRAQLVRVGRGR